MTSFLSFVYTLIMHLWLSVSSLKFYEKVLKFYRGYGLKYILTLSFISAIICSGVFLHRIHKIDDYLSQNINSPEVGAIDQLIGQLPVMEYDGQNISIQENTPIFLNIDSGYRVIAIDPERKLSPKDRIKTPIIFGLDKIVVSFFSSKTQESSVIPVKYSQIFGNQPQTITQEVVKAAFLAIVKKSYSVFIYIMLPAVMTLMIFLNMLLEKSVIIITIYLLMYIMNVRISMKDCIRVALFATGASALLQYVIILTLPDAQIILQVVQLWANLLMILGISKLASNNRLFKL